MQRLHEELTIIFLAKDFLEGDNVLYARLPRFAFKRKEWLLLALRDGRQLEEITSNDELGSLNVSQTSHCYCGLLRT